MTTARRRSLTALALLLAGLAAPMWLTPNAVDQTAVTDASPATRPSPEDVRGGLPDGAVARLGTTRFRQGTPVRVAAVSPDGTHIATADDGTVHLWDAATGRLARDLDADSSSVNAL